MDCTASAAEVAGAGDPLEDVASDGPEPLACSVAVDILLQRMASDLESSSHRVNAAEKRGKTDDIGGRDS